MPLRTVDQWLFVGCILGLGLCLNVGRHLIGQCCEYPTVTTVIIVSGGFEEALMCVPECFAPLFLGSPPHTVAQGQTGSHPL